MTLDEFWEHIRASKREDAEAHAERLVKRLARLPSDGIIDFNHIWDQMLREAYNWNLWGAAYLIKGGCSDDGFEYFRRWLTLQDRDVFQAAIANPDSLADVVDPDDDTIECECYPGMDAWFEATNTEQNEAGFAAFRAACKTSRTAANGRELGF
jgi:hypothetical protein